MSKHQEIIITVVFSFFIFACSDENPSNVFVSQSSEASSSSFIEDYSSSANITALSSETISSKNELSSSSWEPYSYGEVTDKRDRHVYKTIKIGNQTWMAENLNFDYHNRYAQTPALASPSSCYNNEPENCAKYGRLYPWSTIMDSAALFSKTGQSCGVWKNSKVGLCKNEAYNYTRGACPENWHIPTESDINQFIEFAKESPENPEWLNHYWLYGANENFQYELLSQYAYFGSALELDSNKTVVLHLNNNTISLQNSEKQEAHFLRCVKDSLSLIHVEHGELTDERDGQVYKTVKIGNQWWMAENLNFVDTQNTENFKSSCYNNEPDSCTKYGRLYRWRTAMADSLNLNDYDFKARGICPEKWHVPSLNEWKTLVDIVNNFATDLKSKDGWIDDGNGADSFGFNVLPTGYRSYWFNSEWAYLGESACFWTTLPWSDLLMSTTSVVGAFSACFSSDRKDIFFYYEDYEEPVLTVYDEASLRCVKDE